MHLVSFKIGTIYNMRTPYFLSRVLYLSSPHFFSDTKKKQNKTNGEKIEDKEWCITKKDFST